MCEEPSRVVQETPDSDLAARYGNAGEAGHCSLTYQWPRLATKHRAAGFARRLDCFFLKHTQPPLWVPLASFPSGRAPVDRKGSVTGIKMSPQGKKRSRTSGDAGVRTKYEEGVGCVCVCTQDKSGSCGAGTEMVKDCFIARNDD